MGEESKAPKLRIKTQQPPFHRQPQVSPWIHNDGVNRPVGAALQISGKLKMGEKTGRWIQAVQPTGAGAQPELPIQSRDQGQDPIVAEGTRV
jgi:hypothetical protein